MPNQIEGNRTDHDKHDCQAPWTEYLVALKNDGYVGEDECRELTSLSRTTRWRLEEHGLLPV